MYEKVPFFKILNVNKKKNEYLKIHHLDCRNSNPLYYNENHGSLFKRETERYFGSYMNHLVSIQSPFNQDKALQIKRPKLLKEISNFYNKKIYTTLINTEGSVEKTINQMENIKYQDGSYATNIYLNITDFLNLREYLIKEKINAGITLNSIDYYGVKYHNLLEIIPEGEYLALNKHNPPAIINNSIKVDYNKSTDRSRIDVELDVDIEVHNPEDIIHGKIIQLKVK